VQLDANQGKNKLISWFRFKYSLCGGVWICKLITYVAFCLGFYYKDWFLFLFLIREKKG
jgi:hypothetical protein